MAKANEQAWEAQKDLIIWCNSFKLLKSEIIGGAAQRRYPKRVVDIALHHLEHVEEHLLQQLVEASK